MGRANKLAQVAAAYDSGGLVFRNRIINGAMVIDQRNAGASVSIATGDRVTYGVDRFSYQKSSSSYGVTAQRSTVAPAGFINSLVTTVTSAFSPAAGDYLTLGQIIEGFNVADLGWGTANAQTITISFWVRSSVTGTYTFQVGNGAANRAYAVTYTISAANTWEQKTATIAGDTSGTWATDNTAGMWIRWDLGSGSSFNGTTGSWQASSYIKSSSQVTWANNASATFYITGVQLEKGSTATSFDYRPYGTELALCQRYYQRITQTNPGDTFAIGCVMSATSAQGVINPLIAMRTKPAIETTGTAANYRVTVGASNTACSAAPSVDSTFSQDAIVVNFTVASGLTTGQACALRAAASNAYLGFSAEL